MRILLDTHIFLWFVSANPKLPPRIHASILDPNNDIYLSVASVWESVVKYHLGKLPLPQAAEIYMPAQRRKHRITHLVIEEESLPFLAGLPLLHRDPFDRIMIAQSLQHGFTLATVDAKILQYNIPTIST